MGSGLKRRVINHGERATSDDIGALQDYQNAGLMEAWRYLLDVGRGSDGGGDTVEHVSQESPVRAEILGGLMVRPQNGSASLLIDAGLVLMVDPDTAASADDSVYKLVKSAGITSLTAALALTPNSSGTTRIDVVECSRNPQVTLEADQVSQFDPLTGLFAPVSLAKVSEDQLAFRVRTGGNGGGFPGVVQGWLPLAVLSVPTGASNLDACSLWDVRPLVSDRPNLTDRPTTHPLVTKSRLYASDYPGAPGAQLTLAGAFDGLLGGKMVGGQIARGTPGTDAASVVLTDAANQAQGYTPIPGQLAHVYLALPYGLPRWARYGDAANGGRTPRAPLGIIVVSNVPPSPTGEPSLTIPLPTSTGLGGNVQVSEAMHLASTWVSPSGGLYGFATTSDGQMNSAPSNKIGPTTGTTFDFVPGTHFPANASRLLVQFTLTVESNSNTGGAGTVQTFAYCQSLTVLRPGLAGTETNAVLYQDQLGGDSVTSVTQMMEDGQSFYSSTFIRWIDVPPPPSGSEQGTVRVTWNANYQTVAGTNALSNDAHFPPFIAQVVGWA